MKRVFQLTILFTFVLSCVFGCSRSSKPDDFPKLYPCVIKITQDNSPLDGAIVSLVPSDQSNWKWHSSATTDTSGVATVMTYGFVGSPAGKFKVTVEKKLDADPVYSTDSAGEKQVSSYETVYTLVEEQYAKPETTPLTVDVPESSRGVTVNFDVGKAVKVKL
jgi:hypothetical protein